jgi:hypothetical protein
MIYDVIFSTRFFERGIIIITRVEIFLAVLGLNANGWHRDYGALLLGTELRRGSMRPGAKAL